VFILRKNLNEVMPSNNKKREKNRSPSFAMMNKKWCFCFTCMKEILHIRLARGHNINLCLNKPVNREIKNKRLKCNLN
jgi:hypothetical protein